MQDERHPVAAAGDIHCAPPPRDQVIAAFAALGRRRDLVLLAGDLTTHGEPEQAAVLAEPAASSTSRSSRCSGNHDWHCEPRATRSPPMLATAGVTRARAASTAIDVRGHEVGDRRREGLRRRLPGSTCRTSASRCCARSTPRRPRRSRRSTRASRRSPTALCRIVLLHYAPIARRCEGEPERIWAFLGSDRLAAPIARAPSRPRPPRPRARGTFEGLIGAVPVYNVAMQVTAEDFWDLELDGGSVEVA